MHIRGTKKYIEKTEHKTEQRKNRAKNTNVRKNQNLTMRLFHGIVGNSSLNKSVKPNSSTTQLSLSHSTMVLSKSKTTTIVLAIMVSKKNVKDKQKRTNSQEFDSNWVFETVLKIVFLWLVVTLKNEMYL
jgi:hypothetical protein